MKTPIFKRKEKQVQSKGAKVIKIIFLVVIILLVIIALLWQSGYLETLKIARQIQQQQALSAEDEKVLSQLKEIIELPEDITPMMAIVTDPENLKEQQPVFFAKANKGDRVIVYPDMAILYDANSGKIIHIGPVNFGQESLGVVSFALYNGTGEDTKLGEFEKKLTTTFNNAVVKVRNNASQEYDQTLVIDLMGDNPEIQKIADSLGGVVAELPAIEIAPKNTTVLIIVGNDQ